MNHLVEQSCRSSWVVVDSGYLVAAPTLAVAVRLGADTIAPERAGAVIPTPDGPAEIYDLDDLLTDAARADGEPDHDRGQHRTARCRSRCPAPRSGRASPPRWR